MERAETSYVVVQVVVTKEGNQYSSWSPEFDIASCGDSPEEAVKNLGDALELYLNTLEEGGERERVFKEKGINGWLYGHSITHVYLGPFDFEPGNTTPPTKDMSKIMAELSTKTRLGHHLLHRGISTLSARMLILSCVHTIEDIDKTVAALADSLEAMIEEGSLSKA